MNSSQAVVVAIGDIAVNPENPRRNLGDTASLEASIRAHGIIQPIAVRKSDHGVKEPYTVVSGNRRLTAARKAGLGSIPAIVIEIDGADAHEIAAAENIIRENMSPSDEARAVARMVNDGMSRREIAARFGKSSRWVEGRRRLASLGEECLQKLDDGAITFAHAEVLCMADPQDLKKLVDDCRYYTPEQLRNKILNMRRALKGSCFDYNKACAKCPNRSDCQSDLFGDVGEAYCLDSDCYDSKVRAYVEKVTETFNKRGYQEVPEEEEYRAKNCDKYIYRDEYVSASSEREEDMETVSKCKKNGVKPRYIFDDRGHEMLLYRIADLPESERKTETDGDRDYEERRLKEKVRNRANELEEETIRQRVAELLKGASDELVAVLFDYVNQSVGDSVPFGDSITVGEYDYDEGAVVNLGKNTLDGVSQRDFVAESIADQFESYSGCVYKTEGERRFFGMKNREGYEKEAEKEVANGETESEEK